MRYDVGRLRVAEYYDDVLAEYLALQGVAKEEIDFYAQRSAALRSSFGDFSGSVGFAWMPSDDHTLKMNVGKSFRYPGANELASNGLHHGAFRHEQGNSALQPERGYQLDLDYRLRGKQFRFTMNPFLGWFSNYIYLEPTEAGRYSRMRGRSIATTRRRHGWRGVS